MTPLPPADISVELNAAELISAEELEKIQQQLTKLEEELSKLEDYAAKLEKLNLNLSVGGNIKQQIIKGIIDPLLKRVRCPELELRMLQLNLAINLYGQGLKVPTIPAIPDPLKLLLGLQVKIPIELPTIAEFKQYANQQIEEKKRKCQQAAIARQIADAEEDDSPFSARSNARNEIQKQSMLAAMNALGIAKTTAAAMMLEDCCC